MAKRKPKVADVLASHAAAQKAAKEAGTTTGELSKKKAAAVKAAPKKKAAAKKPVAKTPEEYTENIRALLDQTVADISKSNAARNAAYLEEKAAEAREAEIADSPVGELSGTVEAIRAGRRAARNPEPKTLTVSDNDAMAVADATAANPQGPLYGPEKPRNFTSQIEHEAKLKKRVRYLEAQVKRGDKKSAPLLADVKKQLAQYHVVEVTDPKTGEKKSKSLADIATDQLSADSSTRRRDAALQAVKGRGRNVRKTRATLKHVIGHDDNPADFGLTEDQVVRGAPDKVGTVTAVPKPVQSESIPVTSPVTLADSRARFRYFGYDFEKRDEEGNPVFQPTPSADVPARRMFRVQGQENAVVVPYLGVSRNRFPIRSVAREELLRAKEIDRTKTTADIAERLAKLPEMLKMQGDAPEVVKDPETGKLSKENASVMRLMRDIVSVGQFAGETAGVNQKPNITNDAVSALKFYKDMVTRGGFDPSLDQRRLWRKAEEGTAASRDGLPVGSNLDPTDPAFRSLMGTGRSSVPKRRARMRLSEWQAARAETSRRYDELTRGSTTVPTGNGFAVVSSPESNRTPTQQLTDFADEIRTKVIPGVPGDPKYPVMPTTYDPIKEGVNIEGGMTVGEMHNTTDAEGNVDTTYADKVALEAAKNRRRARPLLVVGPTPALPPDSKELEATLLDRSKPRGEAGISGLNFLNEHILAGIDPEFRADVAQRYADWANVGEARSGVGGRGAAGMRLPINKPGEPGYDPSGGSSREPLRGSLVPTPEASIDAPINPKLSELEPAAAEQVQRIDRSDRGMARIAEVYAKLRRAVGIPKPGNTRGIGYDTLLHSQNIAHHRDVIPGLMSVDLGGEEGDAAYADMTGQPGDFLIGRFVRPRGEQKPASWLGGMGQGTGGTNRPLTQAEYDALPTGSDSTPDLKSQIDPETRTFPVRSARIDSPEGQEMLRRSEEHRAAGRERQRAADVAAYTRAGMPIPGHLGGQFNVD